MALAIALVLLIITVVVYSCLVVASDADDRMESCYREKGE